MNMLNGFGYSAQMPPGFNAMPDGFGGYWVIPPASAPPPANAALIWVQSVMPMMAPQIAQQYYAFDNPMVATFNAQSLGLMSVLGVAPLRQANLNGASALIREFDAMSLVGNPMRMSALLLQGPSSAVQVIVGVNLYMWVQFTGPCMQFLAGIRLQGTAYAPAQVRSVIDADTLSHVQVQVVNSDNSVAPIMTLPAEYEGRTILNVHVEAGGTVRFGDIRGTNMQIGDHNTTSIIDRDPNTAFRRIGGMQ